MAIDSQRYFDLRQSIPNLNWDHLGESYLRQYALKKDIEYPLTICTSIWPKVNLEDIGDENDSLDLWRLSVGPSPNHWESLEEFLSAVSKLPKDIRTASTALILDEFEPASGFCALPDSTRVLGYDVADREKWVSGLCNCGYLKEDWVEFDLDRFVPHLNQWHLFDELDPALEFAKISDLRVKEHSPFSVFRLATIDVSFPTG